jgi:monofunctional biosynthetic peptidoglycan transglycosylase
MNPLSMFSGKLKILFKCGLILFLVLVVGGALFAAWLFHDLPDIAALQDRNRTFTIDVRDWQGETHPFQVGPKNRHWAPIEAMPNELKWAVIAAEDASFYQHKGIDYQAVKEALIYDLKQKRLARGASTIPQQLAKNLYLSRDKSILRKLREIVIAVRMEKLLTKSRILELYLNVVELGPLVYGVGHGAWYHFARPVEYLTPAQSSVLAAILPGPRVAFNPETRPEKVRKRAARLLGLLGVRDVLNDEEIDAALTELDFLSGSQPDE